MLRKQLENLCYDERFKIRQKKEVKKNFFAYVSEFFKERGVDGCVDGDFGKKFKPANLIFGDENQAEIFLTAHYDTPKNNFLLKPMMYIFNRTGFFAQIIAFIILAGLILLINFSIQFPVDIILISFILIVMAFYSGFSTNKFNYNDNMSGCIALLYIVDKVKREHPELLSKLCFVFTDMEELGCLGAFKLNKRLEKKIDKDKLKEKINLNFDCIGGRDNVNLIITNTDSGLEIAKEINKGKEYKIYKWFIVNMDTQAFKKIRSISFCMGSVRFGIKSLFGSKDIHTNKDNYLDYEKVKYHANTAYQFIVEKYK